MCGSQRTAYLTYLTSGQRTVKCYESHRLDVELIIGGFTLTEQEAGMEIRVDAQVYDTTQDNLTAESG